MKRADERGSALIAALWGVLALAAIAAAFTAFMGTQTREHLSLIKAREAARLADAAIEIALADIARDTPRLKADGTPASVRMGAATLRVRIFNEDGKIDLNRGSPVLLGRLLEILAAEGRLAGIDTAALREELLARRAERPFAEVGELRVLKAMNRSALEGLRPFVTVHGIGAKIDPLTAPREVLIAVPGLSPAMAERLIAARQAGEPLPAVPSEAAIWLAERTPSIYLIEGAAQSASGARASRRRIVFVERNGKDTLIRTLESGGGGSGLTAQR